MPEVMIFWYLKPVFIKVTSAGLNSLRQKRCKNSTWYFVILQKKILQNIKIKLNSRTWMTLKSSVVIFQTLEPQQPQWPLQPQQPRWPQWPLQPHFIKDSSLHISICQSQFKRHVSIWDTLHFESQFLVRISYLWQTKVHVFCNLLKSR